MAQVQKCDVCGVLAEPGKAEGHAHGPMVGGCHHLPGWGRLERFIEAPKPAPEDPAYAGLGFPRPPMPFGFPPQVLHESKDVCPACLKRVDDALKRPSGN